MQVRERELQEQKKHGEPGFPMTVYYNDFTQYVGEQIPWHWHEELEFVVVTEGVVEFFVGTEDFLLREGEGIFVNADTLHHVVPHGEKKAYMFSILLNHGILGAGQGILLSSKYVSPYVAEAGVRYEVLRAETVLEKEAVGRLKEIYRIYMEKEFGYEYALHNLICEVWFYLVREKWGNRIAGRRGRSVSEERIYRALEFIHAGYAQPISLEDICEAVNISKTECCRCFKQNLRMTPFEYLMTYRVNKAAEQLESDNETITEIAAHTGFGSDSYFCKQFKRYMGCTPMEYRRRSGKTEEEAADCLANSCREGGRL
ncbi:MAG: AraC family transcriptional regulator [Lachnospiraceae bacterium]|nr:AraC family transcriptional regulator [Lachnospiraceae bacterium]